MSVTPTDFFDPTARNSRARQAVAVELMRELSRYSDPGELSRVFARRMNQLYPTSRQITLSRRGLSLPEVRVTRFSGWHNPPDPFRESEKLPVVRGGVFAEWLADDQPRVLDRLDLDPADPAAEYLAGQQSVLCIPVFDAGQPTTAVVLTREAPDAFPREQVPELVWLTNLFGRATQSLLLSSRLQEAYDAAEYELRTIAEFQQNLLPDDVPQVPGLDVGVHYRTAQRAGGDYYDFFPMDDGKLGVLVADVSGHGTPAAVLMAVTHSMTHARPDAPHRPGEFLSFLNHQLAKRYTVATGHFVTATYAVFDPKRGTVTFASAGHAAPRGRVNGAEKFEGLEQVRRLPLGVTHRTVGAYPEQTLRLKAGDAVALFTDGITESLNGRGEPFGEDRLDAVLSRPFTCSACAVSEVVAELERFTDAARPADDRTLVLVSRTECGGEKWRAKAATCAAPAVPCEGVAG
ncbi:MAG: SpoIIE family protein phosphatase [Fimbriiglobus sp.]|jgi:sigma-B regulation protein RsbU (phosphoserine phosphatase)|nr:SpoIIE family protein phosphatase [Fimbriiglobus sp.]